MKIKLLVNAGDIKPGPALSQKLGPAGINIGKVIQEVNSATSSFKGIKVPIELDIDNKTKEFKVRVFTPPASELLKKELEAEKGSSQPDKIKIGNLAIEQIVSVAKTKMPGMLTSDFKLAVKSVLGNCVSLGILVENKSIKEVLEEIENGVYADEIKNQKVNVSEEKRKELDDFFSEIKEKQDAIIEKEKAEAEKKEEAKPTEGEAPEEEVAEKKEEVEKKPTKKK